MNHKIDIAIQSYKKPESLIYTLLSLYKHCKNHIDTVWINDDQSGSNILEVYRSKELKQAIAPWKIRIRENRTRMGWWLSFVKDSPKPRYLSKCYMLIRMLWNIYKTGHAYVTREDIRYQWAIDNTDKFFLMILHDDVIIYDNIVQLYISAIKRLKNPCAVGDLGQCWRCTYRQKGCVPALVSQGIYPSAQWPKTKIKLRDHAWACRINEWCALISVEAAKQIEAKYHVFFGNFDNKGDTAAYWFSLATKEGYNFNYPFGDNNHKETYYSHGYNGKSGHSVWVDQGEGKIMYDSEEIKRKLKIDFSFNWPKLEENIA